MADTLYLPTGPYPFYYGICLSQKAFDKELERVGITEKCAWILDGKAATMHTFTSEQVRGLFCLTCFDLDILHEVSVDARVGLIVHECVHVWQTLLDYMGETSPGKEIEAYSLQWMVQQTLAALDEEVQARSKKATRRRK